MIFNGGADGTGATEGVRIAFGSYNGTGGYGSSNKCKITFDFVPKFIYINPVRKLTNTFYPGACAGIPASGVLNAFLSSKSSGSIGEFYNTFTAYAGTLLCELNGKTLSWYSDNNSVTQMNAKEMRYSWVAIG